jgi:hypothetical protein
MLIDRVRSARDVWATLIPFVSQPEPRQFALWANRFNDSIIEKAFWRASKKFNPEKVQVPDAVMVYRYATSVMLNEERERSQGVGVAS